MSAKLRKQIDVERQQLLRLIDEHSPLLESCVSTVPTAIEIDGAAPSGDARHRQLLMSMATVTDRRPAVLSETLYEALGEYLSFRHFFRQAYSFHLDWSKMSHLVLNAERHLKLFETEMGTFIASLSKEQ